MQKCSWIFVGCSNYTKKDVIQLCLPNFLSSDIFATHRRERSEHENHINVDGKKWVKIVFNCIIFISFTHHILIRSLSLLWKIDTLHVCCFSIFCIRNKTNIDEKFSSISFECFIKWILSMKSDDITYPAFAIRL